MAPAESDSAIPETRPGAFPVPHPAMGHQVLPAEQGYELWASTYDGDLNPLLALEERILGPLLLDLEDKTILDVACGTGRWLLKLRESRAGRALGVDVSPAMLARAAAKSPLHGHLIRGNALALPLPSKVADLVVCSFAVGHISPLDDFARELARVIKPEGRLLVSDLHPGAYDRGWRNGFRVGNARREIASFAYSMEQLPAPFRRQGFELLERLQLYLGEAERPIFERAGRLHLFSGACEVPAVLICHFRRDSTASSKL